MQKKSLFRIGIALALVAGVVALVVWKPWAGSGDGGLKFTTVEVKKGTISAQVTATGTLAANNTVLVGAQVSGRVVEIFVDFNDKVKKGQVIARLDPSVLEAQLQQQSASLASAEANLQRAQVVVEDAKRQFERQKGLREQDLTAATAFEAAQVALDSATASVAVAQASKRQAQAAVSQARLNLSYSTIYSPVDGVVISRSVDVGQTVAASLQAPTLFTIAEDLARMKIDTSVAESDIGNIAAEMKAVFTVDAFPGRNFDGRVLQVRYSPTTVQGVVTYNAVIAVDNTDLSLKPGMTANITFVLNEVKDAIKLPNSALRFKPTPDDMKALFAASGMKRPEGKGPPGAGGPPGGGPSGGGPSGGGGGRAQGGGGAADRVMLWKLVDGKPQPARVKTGLTDGSTTQLVDGDIKEGDLLITEVTGVPKARRKMGAF